MKISRHIHYLQNPTTCLRYEMIFDPAIDVESTLGKVDSFYAGGHFFKDGSSNRIERTANVINKNGILQISEIMNIGERLSIEIAPGLRLDKLVVSDAHNFQILAGNNGFVYDFHIGKNGAVSITAIVIEDKDNYFAKLKANLKDTAWRDYLIKKTLADNQDVKDAVENVPDILKAEEAWDYLRIGRTTFYRLVKSGEIKQNKNRRYLKDDLDKYKNQKLKK